MKGIISILIVAISLLLVFFLTSCYNNEKVTHWRLIQSNGEIKCVSGNCHTGRTVWNDDTLYCYKGNRLENKLVAQYKFIEIEMVDNCE